MKTKTKQLLEEIESIVETDDGVEEMVKDITDSLIRKYGLESYGIVAEATRNELISLQSGILKNFHQLLLLSGDRESAIQVMTEAVKVTHKASLLVGLELKEGRSEEDFYSILISKFTEGYDAFQQLSEKARKEFEKKRYREARGNEDRIGEAG